MVGGIAFYMIVNHLFTDNSDALLKEMQTTGELVKDALTELEQVCIPWMYSRTILKKCMVGK